MNEMDDVGIVLYCMGEKLLYCKRKYLFIFKSFFIMIDIFVINCVCYKWFVVISFDLNSFFLFCLEVLGG